MTLVIALHSRETIWLLTDRRLSKPGDPPTDNARKMLLLGANDGAALIGYSGLGATPSGNEPGDWMGRVLESLDLPLEQLLGKLAAAIEAEIPAKLTQLATPNPVHTFVVSAFINHEVRIYTIDAALSPDRKKYSFQYQRRVAEVASGIFRMPPCLLAGTGSGHLQHTSWKRPLFRLVRASSKNKASPQRVADYLATLNSGVAAHEPTVSPRCIVAWLNQKAGPDGEVGGIALYDGTAPEKWNAGEYVPSILGGIDFNKAQKRVGTYLRSVLLANLAGDETVRLDPKEIDARLSYLGDKRFTKLL
jgi:hypothetical protein